MNLDERSNQVFISMVHSVQESSKGLMKKFALSRGQLNYDLKKINEWLSDNHFEPIKRTKNGYLIIPNEVRKKYQSKNTSIDHLEDYLYSMQERIYLIEVMLLSKEEYLSLNHFIEALKLSKNTVLRALKVLERSIISYHLALKYSRLNGYYIEGTEWDKRQLLRDALNLLAETNNGYSQIIEFAQLKEEELIYYKQKLDSIENELNVRFTDEQIAILPLFFLLILRRITKGKTIQYDFEIDFDVLMNTKEYQAMKEISEVTKAISKEEEIYLTLQLLATNVSTANILTKGELFRMQYALNEMLLLFEKSSAIRIENRVKLLTQLMQHMKPAYYRIKYEINLINPFYEANKEKKTALFYLAKESIGPLEKFFDHSISDVEIFFISLFIGSHILGTKDFDKEKGDLIAAIVCPNGTSVSILLEQTLKRLLPEINFLPVMSIREFYKKEPLVNYVFSAVPVKTNKELFVISSFLTEREKRQLRQQVLMTADELDQNRLTPEKIIKVIKKHGAITDEIGLYHELLEMVEELTIPAIEKKKLDLVDLIKISSIQIISEKISWEETLICLSEPLLEKKVIEPSYVTKLLKEFPKIPTQIVLREAIALPHTEPEYGALDVGMSLGIVKRGLSFKNKKLYFVFLLASNDKEKHVEAIFQLMELAGNRELLKKMKAVNSKEEVIQLLHEFMKGYRRE